MTSQIITSVPIHSVSNAAHRSAASNTLWAHILRKDLPSSSKTVLTAPGGPQIAPLDKNATSMRVLLHDTRANLEKFSERVDKLTSGVSETKGEIKVMQKLFQEDREMLVSQTVNLVNRCQAEVQKSLGAPAQAVALVELHNETHITRVKFDALEKRVDALQMSMDSQSRALDTQSKTLQIMQDQQAKIIEAVLPLLPLLQGMPLVIEASKISIKESIQAFQISTAQTSLLANVLPHQDPPQAPPNSRKRRRTSTFDETLGPSTRYGGEPLHGPRKDLPSDLQRKSSITKGSHYVLPSRFGDLTVARNRTVDIQPIYSAGLPTLPNSRHASPTKVKFHKRRPLATLDLPSMSSQLFIRPHQQDLAYDIDVSDGSASSTFLSQTHQEAPSHLLTSGGPNPIAQPVESVAAQAHTQRTTLTVVPVDQNLSRTSVTSAIPGSTVPSLVQVNALRRASTVWASEKRVIPVDDDSEDSDEGILPDSTLS